MKSFTVLGLVALAQGHSIMQVRQLVFCQKHFLLANLTL